MGLQNSECDSFRRVALIAMLIGCLQPQLVAQIEVQIEAENDRWLFGSLVGPPSSLRSVLILNPGEGGQKLAQELGDRGIQSLLLDLPGSADGWQTYASEGEAEADVWYALGYLRDRSRFTAVFAAQNAAEEAAEAGRNWGFAHAYVIISPNLFSQESIQKIATSKVPWLFIESSGDGGPIRDVSLQLRMFGRNVEMVRVPTISVGTNLLLDRQDLPERIATWIDAQLR